MLARSQPAGPAAVAGLCVRPMPISVLNELFWRMEMNYNLSMTPSTIKSKRARLILTYTILNDFSVGGPYCASIMLLDTLKKHSTLQQKTRSINVLIVLMFDTVFINVQYCKLH